MKKIQVEGFELYLRNEKDWGLWQNGFYEPEVTSLVKSIVKPDWKCLDIGANIGYYTILLAKLCKYVVAWEPEPSNWDMIEMNRELNKINNVFVYRQAVSDKEGEATLYISDINNGMNRLYKSKQATLAETKVNTITIDDIWNTGGHPSIDFIKMDIEGAELGALKGMKQMLEELHPIIIMEFHPDSIIEYGANPKTVYNFVKKLGYSVRLIPNNYTDISYGNLMNKLIGMSNGQNLLLV